MPDAVADVCPGLLRLHEAGDGLLARVRLPGGRLDVRAARAVAELAASGNGIVELTSRANLQVRGLTDAALAQRLLTAAGLLRSPAHDRVRNIVASPLAGRLDGAVAVDAIVDELDAELCADPAVAGLPGRFLFAVEDGSQTHGVTVPDVELDVRSDRLVLAGARTDLPGTPQYAVAAARAFLAIAAGAWRIVDVDRGAQRIAESLGGGAGERLPRRGSSVSAGVQRQQDGRHAVTALAPLQRFVPAALSCDVRVGSGRTVTIVDTTDPEAAAGELRAAGLLTDPESGWTDLTACSGLGACARARGDVRAAALRRASVREASARREHWAACERQCGRPTGDAITVTVTDAGTRVGDRLLPTLDDAVAELNA
jgi:precorrin-3B synthase